METALNPYEARVLGVLIEKSFTTPDQYPLSLNATTNACNQKSCRKPVVDFTEAEVLVTLKGIRMKHMGGGTIPANSRVERWHHSAREHWKLSDPCLAVLAELLLRGPASAAALRSNANRMTPLASSDDLENAVRPLEEAGLVKRLPPGQGVRVMQFAQTLCAEQSAPGVLAQTTRTTVLPAETVNQDSGSGHSLTPAPAGSSSSGGAQGPNLPSLEKRVQTLEQQLRTLAEKLGETL